MAMQGNMDYMKVNKFFGRMPASLSVGRMSVHHLQKKRDLDHRQRKHDLDPPLLMHNVGVDSIRQQAWAIAIATPFSYAGPGGELLQDDWFGKLQIPPEFSVGETYGCDVWMERCFPKK